MIRRRTLIEKAVSKPSILLTEITAIKRQNSIDVCRVSIMPTSIDDEKDEGC